MVLIGIEVLKEVSWLTNFTISLRFQIILTNIIRNLVQSCTSLRILKILWFLSKTRWIAMYFVAFIYGMTMIIAMNAESPLSTFAIAITEKLTSVWKMTNVIPSTRKLTSVISTRPLHCITFCSKLHSVCSISSCREMYANFSLMFLLWDQRKNLVNRS